ncbi:MAG: diacylglycerol kinase family lipid kinase [Acidobacteria bacterium]|nr:diacylglycerol kinase family lipid kinase [Acidobacteriota bacterium]MBU4307160.1 diacylglycerol kinase family lipid kinase [Acidobacteriota bacterium]MBU4405454.1 diacylglycerol kinase family lipid kinase [Acidobacteriota bacterium]MCG2812682.1 diacylglycerol kinase family lipid kinase [Candidatus Aminicenantes bacterium]
MNKVHVIVNPFSARGQTEKRWETIKHAIRSHFREFKYIFTEKPRQATEIARELLKQGFDLLIGVGGDGTLNEISNGFFNAQSDRVINDDAAVGIIPSGTGSDFIRFMKVPREFEKSAARIKNSPNKKIDIGKITYGSAVEKSRSQYFINVADFGMGAEVIRNISNIKSSRRGAFTYFRGLLSTIMKYRSKNVKLTIDDKQQLQGEYLIGAVANGRIFGGGMIIAPQAEPDDGYFDLVLIESMKKFEILTNSRLLYSGTIAKNPKVHILKARNIKVESPDEVHIEYDGEMGEKLPAEFSIIERALNFRI